MMTIIFLKNRLFCMSSFLLKSKSREESFLRTWKDFAVILTDS